jgi:hypothetical protein
VKLVHRVGFITKKIVESNSCVTNNKYGCRLLNLENISTEGKTKNVNYYRNVLLNYVILYYSLIFFSSRLKHFKKLNITNYS